MRGMSTRRLWMMGGLFGYMVVALALVIARNTSANERAAPTAAQPQATFTHATYSSPVSLSADNKLVWVVNPDEDSVSVLRTDTNAVVKKLFVGDEPQSIALDPNNQFAYVANAAAGTVSVIKITNADPATFIASVDSTLTTGAEPWNIVMSPDGQRVFVANSSQDTITVINTATRAVIGSVDLRNSVCNDPDRNRHFQPRGLAVTDNSARLLVTRFLSFTKTGGVQGSDDGKEGVVCRLNINTASTNIADYAPAATIKLAAAVTGFKIDANADGVLDDTLAYPNQMQSVVIRGDKAYLPNIASSPSRPLRFNVDTQAFINRIDGVTTTETDASAFNTHLGARVPKPGKGKVFFANPWAMAFTTQVGVGSAYMVSSGSDGLVKLNVGADGALSFTDGVSTTTFIDLNDPTNPATSGANAGKNPLGIAINDAGTTAYVMNYVSRNVSIINLTTDTIAAVVKTTELPPPGTLDETLQVGKEIFFSSRGVFNNGKTMRLSADGWQNCASCHFAGLTDGNIWQFGSGPRKSIPLNATWNPHNPSDQRILNYSAIFDEVQDFEANIRNVSGPGNKSAGPPPVLDENHGLLVGDDGNVDTAPGAVPPLLGKANGGRPQLTVTLPGSTVPVPALDAMKEWVRFAVRTPRSPLTTAELTAGNGSSTAGVNPAEIAAGRVLFARAGCQSCHSGGKWSISVKDFDSPPAATEVFTEKDLNKPADPAAPNPAPNPNAGQYLARFLRDIKSFNLNVPGAGNLVTGQAQIGAVEKDTANLDALGLDYDGDGKGAGFNPPGLLGIYAVPPYYHNGACETLACVLADTNHRTAGLKPGRPDVLVAADQQRKLILFLESLDADTAPAADLSIRRHDLFFDPPVPIAGTTITVGVNISLFGPKVPIFDPGPVVVTFFDGQPGQPGTTTIGTANLASVGADFGQATVAVPWAVPTQPGLRRIFVSIDSTDLFDESDETNNTVNRQVLVRPVPPDRTPPAVSNVQINDGAAITASPNVAVTFSAVDPPSPNNAQTSGLSSFCLVRYFFNASLHLWVPQTCASFQPLPAANSNGNFTVNTQLTSQAGVAYTFVWVKDKAGNISKVPGFDVISVVPASTVDIDINRNDVRVFRITLNPGQTTTMTFTPSFGDVDVSVFSGIGIGAQRIALSANNGPQPETVTFSAPAGGTATTFQVEVRAIVSSRIRIGFTQALALLQATTASSPAQVTDGEPFVAGPPALQTEIDLLTSTYLPLSSR